MGHSLKEMLKAKGITPYRIQKDLGVSEGAVRGWMKGQIPRGDHLLKLAKYLEVSPYMIVWGREPRTKISSEALYLAEKITKFERSNPGSITLIKKLIELFMQEMQQRQKALIKKTKERKRSEKPNPSGTLSLK